MQALKHLVQELQDGQHPSLSATSFLAYPPTEGPTTSIAQGGAVEAVPTSLQTGGLPVMLGFGVLPTAGDSLSRSSISVAGGLGAAAAPSPMGHMRSPQQRVPQQPTTSTYLVHSHPMHATEVAHSPIQAQGLAGLGQLSLATGVMTSKPRDFASQVMELKFSLQHMERTVHTLAQELGGWAAEEASLGARAGFTTAASAGAASSLRNSTAGGAHAHALSLGRTPRWSAGFGQGEEDVWVVENVQGLQDACNGLLRMLRGCVREVAPHR